MYQKINPYILNENIERILTNFYIDFSGDKQLFSDIISTFKNCIDMFGDMYQNIAYNVSIDTTELNRKIPFAVIPLPLSFKNEYNEIFIATKTTVTIDNVWNDAYIWVDEKTWEDSRTQVFDELFVIYQGEKIKWEPLPIFDKIKILFNSNQYIDLNSKRLWDKEQSPILNLRVGYKFSGDTLAPSSWLESNKDFVFYNNRLFIFPEGMRKLSPYSQIYLYDIFVDYNKIDKGHASLLGVKNDLLFSKHAYRGLVSNYSRLLHNGLNFKTVREVLTQMPGWELVSIYDKYNAADHVQHAWESSSLNLKRFDFLLYGALSKSTGENYREIAALRNIISAAKNSHTSFDLVLYFFQQDKKRLLEKIWLQILPDEFPEQQKFINDIVKTIRIYEEKESKRLYDESVVRNIRIIPDGHTYIDFITYEKEQTLNLSENALYNGKTDFVLDSDYAFYLDSELRGDLMLDRLKVAIGPSDYVEVLYFD